jgi:hypothetical protein
MSNGINEALQHIVHCCPDAVVGGSIAFIARGLLTREPADIDLFFCDGDSLTKNGLFDCFIDEVGSDTVTNMDGNPIQRTSLKIMGIKVCAFKVENREMEHDELMYNDILIRAQKPEFGIAAKLIYQDKNGKHAQDLQEIRTKLKSKL